MIQQKGIKKTRVPIRSTQARVFFVEINEEDVNPDMPALFESVGGPNEENNSEQMPFQFLERHISLVKGIAHHGVVEDDEHH